MTGDRCQAMHGDVVGLEQDKMTLPGRQESFGITTTRSVRKGTIASLQLWIERASPRLGGDRHSVTWKR